MGLTVGSSGDKLKKQTTKRLEHGEFLVASGKFLRRGGAKRRAGGFLLGGVVGAHFAGNAEQPGSMLFGRALPGNLALAVTDRRVLVLRLSEATERVCEVTHSIPLREITEVETDVGSSVGMKAVHVEIAFRDGSAVSVEAVRPNTKAGEEVARALTTALARR